MKRSFGNMRLGGRYRLQDRIAFGGMGEVWRALDEVLGRKVAVKILRPELAYDDSFRRRFRAEARTAGALSHPGIAAVYDYGEGPVLPADGPAQPITPSTPGHGALTGDEVAYLVMELVPGEPLSAMLSRGALGVDATLDVVAQTARALHAAHERGVVHRDVKPANLLVTPDGTLKVTDFGIARPRDHEPLTMTGQVMGTAHYLAPELARGREATPLSDVYALGVVMYECLAGRRPFEGDNQVAVATAHLAEPPPPLPETLPEDVRELVDMAMEKDVEHRIRSAADFAHELEVVLRKRRRPQRTGGEPGGRTGAMRREIDLRDGSGPSAVRAAAAGAAGAGALGAAGAAAAAAAPTEGFTEQGAGYEQTWGYEGQPVANGYNGYANGYQNGYQNGYGTGYDADSTEAYGDYGRAAAGLAGAGYGAEGPPTPTDDLGLGRNGGSHRDRDRRVVPFALTWQTGLLALAVLLVIIGVVWVAVLVSGTGGQGGGKGSKVPVSPSQTAVSSSPAVKTTGAASSPASRTSPRRTNRTTRGGTTVTTTPSRSTSSTTTTTTTTSSSSTTTTTTTTTTDTGTVTSTGTDTAPPLGGGAAQTGGVAP